MTAPVPLRLATSILLIRDGARGLEVLLMRRHRQVDFVAGATVFPGGRVDESDLAPALALHCRGADELSDESRALRVSAVRELFEECGILLASARGTTDFVPAAQALALSDAQRSQAEDEAGHLLRLLEKEVLELGCDCLVPFAHWITPEFMPKRFDTHFFLAVAPNGQLAQPDGVESTETVWMRPSDALVEADAGRHTIIFPTRMNLEKLGRARDTAQALDRARRDPIVTVLPFLEDDGLRIPEEAGYGVSKIPLEVLKSQSKSGPAGS